MCLCPRWEARWRESLVPGVAIGYAGGEREEPRFYNALQAMYEPPQFRRQASLPNGGIDGIYLTSNLSEMCPPFHATGIVVELQVDLERSGLKSIVCHQLLEYGGREARGGVPDTIGWLDDHILGTRVGSRPSLRRRPSVQGGDAEPTRQRGNSSLSRKAIVCGH